MNRYLILVLVCITFLLVRCSPALLSTVIISGSRAVKSASVRNQALNLEPAKAKVTVDSIKYARYFIYRSGSFIGSALSCLIYDNNDYVGVASLRTFEKVDSVISGDHYFSSKVGAKKSIKFHFEPGKTYIIKAWAATTIVRDELRIMNDKMIKDEIAKGNFFSKQFLATGLKVEDISY